MYTKYFDRFKNQIVVRGNAKLPFKGIQKKTDY